jgi:cytochrome P450
MVGPIAAAQNSRAQKTGYRAGSVPVPRHIGRWASFPLLWQFGINPLAMLQRLHRDRGPFVVLTYLQSRQSRPAQLGIVSDAGLYRLMFTDSESWRNVKIVFDGLKGHASDRLSFGFTRLRGARHAHYRRLLAKPLARPAVAAMNPAMAEHVHTLLEACPRDTPIDLIELAQQITQGLAIGLLFGDDTQRARAVTRMIQRQFDGFPPLPGWNYLKWLSKASEQERLLIEWAEQKRGDLDARDMLSILANSPDEHGREVSRELIASIMSFTFGAAYETCRNGLSWILIMLAQHPDIALRLGEEIRGAIGTVPPTMDRIDGLPLLDGVVKESLRLFPPVPILARKSLVATVLGATEFPAGTMVLVSCFLINRNPEIYPEPERYCPDRWNGFEPPPEHYAVFGLGGRTCPGFVFGSQILKISLASIFSRFNVEILPNSRIDYASGVMLAPHPRVSILLRPVDRIPSAANVTGRIHELVQLPQTA